MAAAGQARRVAESLYVVIVCLAHRWPRTYDVGCIMHVSQIQGRQRQWPWLVVLVHAWQLKEQIAEIYTSYELNPDKHIFEQKIDE